MDFAQVLKVLSAYGLTIAGGVALGFIVLFVLGADGPNETGTAFIFIVALALAFVVRSIFRHLRKP